SFPTRRSSDLPDYLNFLLTGKKANEYTNATSTQLVNAFSKQWDKELMELLGIDSDMFQEILPPKSELGSLRSELVEEFGFDMTVLLPATHDTGSAVVAVPESEDSIYISRSEEHTSELQSRFDVVCRL